METDSKPTTKRGRVRLNRTLSMISTMFRGGRASRKPLTGRAGALAALDRLCEENSEGLKRLADG